MYFAMKIPFVMGGKYGKDRIFTLVQLCINCNFCPTYTWQKHYNILQSYSLKLCKSKLQAMLWFKCDSHHTTLYLLTISLSMSRFQFIHNIDLSQSCDSQNHHTASIFCLKNSRGQQTNQRNWICLIARWSEFTSPSHKKLRQLKIS